MNSIKLSLLILLVSTFLSRADTLTVPANGPVGNGGFAVDVGAGTTGRYQEIFPSTTFPGLDGPIYITEFAWRRGFRDVSNPGQGALPMVEIKMSTTDRTPDNASVPLDRNVGSNLAVVYPPGPLSVTLGEKLDAFEIKFRLAQPYLYDHRNGNLLIDIRFTAGDEALRLGFLDIAAGPIRMGIEANGGLSQVQSRNFPFKLFQSLAAWFFSFMVFCPLSLSKKDKL
jgi:hypothetical protein